LLRAERYITRLKLASEIQEFYLKIDYKWHLFFGSLFSYNKWKYNEEGEHHV